MTSLPVLQNIGIPTHIVGTIANMLCNDSVFKGKFHGVIFGAFNNGFVLARAYFFGFVNMTVLKIR